MFVLYCYGFLCWSLLSGNIRWGPSRAHSLRCRQSRSLCSFRLLKMNNTETSLCSKWIGLQTSVRASSWTCDNIKRGEQKLCVAGDSRSHSFRRQKWTQLSRTAHITGESLAQLHISNINYRRQLLRPPIKITHSRAEVSRDISQRSHSR